MIARVHEIPALLFSTLVLASQAHAVVIASTDFTANLGGLTFDGTAGGNTAGYGTAGPNGTRAIDLIDVSAATNASIARYTPGTAFNTASPGQSQFQLTYDVAVSNLTVGSDNAVAVPRIILRNTVTGSQGLTVAFTRNSAGNMVLYAVKGDGVAVTATGALIYSFGTYDTVTSANNTTNGYITISISFISGGTSMDVSAIQGANTLFSGTIGGYSALDMANTNTNLIMSTGATGISNLHIDNLLMQTIPEPGSVVLSASAIGLLAFRRSRRK